MRQHLRRLREERGQAGLMMVLALFFLIVPMSVAVFDVGLLMNDRRDAQSDADKAALAGAQDLNLDINNTGWTNAVTDTRAWLTRNGVNPDTQASISPALASDCFSNLTSAVVTYYGNTPIGVNVSINRQSPSFLASALGVSLKSGAYATACAGVPIEYHGILPLVVSEQGLLGTCFDSNSKPIPGADCKVRVQNDASFTGALTVAYTPNGNVDCSSTGSGANDLQNNLQYGVQGWCSVGQTVTAKTGEVLNKTFSGIQSRLSLDGACDTAYKNGGGTQSALNNAWNALNSYLASYPNYTYSPPPTSDNRGPIPGLGDHIDDFYEVWNYPGPTAPASQLQDRPCPGYVGDTNSPRNVVLIVVPNALDSSGNAKQYVIQQFARMYLEGCTLTTTNGKNTTSEFRRDCSWSSLGSGRLTIDARYVEQVGGSTDNLGLPEQILGDVQVFLKQ